MTKRRGMFLPVVAVILMLVMLSVLMLSRFGTDTRSMLRRAEAAELCRQAAESALCEMRTAVDDELQGAADGWPDWWRKLLPPYDTTLDDPAPAVAVPVTAAAFAPCFVTLDGLTIRCLDRRPGHQVKAQGLVEFAATATCTRPGDAPVALTRTERCRYYVQYETVSSTPDPANPAVSYPVVVPSVTFFPLCAAETGEAP